jgi:hypothetical protein
MGLLFDGDDGDGDGGGDGITCTNVLSVLIGKFPTLPLTSWLCVYNCNTICPGTMDEIYVRIFTLPGTERCPKYMRREDL